jgi:hypothetical protein
MNFWYIIQPCFIYRPLDLTVSKYAGIDPRHGFLKTFMEPRNRFPCRLEGQYDNPIPTRFLAPINEVVLNFQHLEYHSVGPLVRIGSPQNPSPASHASLCQISSTYQLNLIYAHRLMHITRLNLNFFVKMSLTTMFYLQEFCHILTELTKQSDLGNG